MTVPQQCRPVHHSLQRSASLTYSSSERRSAGTTAWVEYLSSHPDIFFPVIKEPHFFSPDIPKPEGFNNFPTEERYLALFSRSGNAKIVGEGSVRYLQSREAAKNIRRFNPDAKIIIFVRDQEDYLPSLHNQMVFNGDECIIDFEAAWRLSGKRDETNMSPSRRHPKLLDYIAAGNFPEQVERFFHEFPEEQVRIFHFRDWSRNPRATYWRSCASSGSMTTVERNFRG